MSRNGLIPYTSSRFTGSAEEYAKYVTCNSIPLAKQKLFLLEKTTPITYCILYFLTDSLSLHTAQIMWQSNMLTLYIRTFWCDYCIVLAIMWPKMIMWPGIFLFQIYFVTERFIWVLGCIIWTIRAFYYIWSAWLLLSKFTIFILWCLDQRTERGMLC